MKENLEIEQEIPVIESIVMMDECGDSLWDAVLKQNEEPPI
ncbi:MAG: hypothetical protein V4585_21780 [Bacteroidota bacterium]|jgi:hypothetical protein